MRLKNLKLGSSNSVWNIKGSKMIVEAGMGTIAQKKIQELNKLREIKLKNPSYRIIDIGGGKEKHVPDKFNFIDATMDFRDVVQENIKHFSGNINDPFLWEEVYKEVKKMESMITVFVHIL